GKITNQWNPYNLTNLLYQKGETGAFSLPLGMNQSIIGDDYIVPLHTGNSTIGRIAIGLDPIVIPWPPVKKHDWDRIIYDPNNPIFTDPSLLVASFFSWKKGANACGYGDCPAGQVKVCFCYYVGRVNHNIKESHISIGKECEDIINKDFEILDLVDVPDNCGCYDIGAIPSM
ncbi:MAG TPA: hypothetical protein PLV00_08095, partial [Caldisericia bacterium]|nr:hypothetical protein [Caldisericia bacterium]